eukprot:SAG25_NODE_11184_length_311_cov_1.117925_1_plen_69_part_10
MAYEWTANDWSNIVTIASAALASVLLVLFKSRCTQIRLCYGCWSCTRDVQQTGSDDEAPTPAPAPEPEQ